MKKTIFALLLVVALVVTLAVPALAAEPTELYHCVCGAKWFASAEEETPSIKNEACANGCLKTKNLKWLPLSENLVGNEGAKSLPATGNFYLDKDINVDNTTYSKILRIDLNGHTLSRTKNRILHVKDGNDRILVVTDTSAEKNGVIQSNSYQGGGNAAVILVESGSFSLYAGTIDGAPAHANGTATPDPGGSVYIYASKPEYNPIFNMYGGTITGGYAKYGGNVAVGAKDANCGNAEFNMYGGTIKDGVASSSGGNLTVRLHATFNMYGGTIQNGSTEAGDNKHAGNIRVSDGGDFTMTGGIIKDGIANGKEGDYPSKAGNIMASGTDTTVTIGGNAQILGGTAKEPTTNSVWINTGATLTVTGGRIEKDILVVGTAKVSGGQFDTTDMSKYFQLTSNMTLIGDLGVAGETLTLTEDTYIDLNGHNILSNIDTGDFTLYLSDSATADYDVKDGKYGKVTGEIKGKVARDYVNGSKQRYLVVKTAEGYSAHRIYMAVTNSIIDGTNNGGMKYTTVLKCDEVVAGLIADYGVVFNGETASYYGANETCTIGAWDGTNMNEKVTKVFEILKSGAEGNAVAAETAYAVKAYITLNDTFGDEFKTVNSAAKERSMQEMIVKAVANWNNLTAEQQATLKAIYNAFNNGAYMDDKNKWPNVADKLK